MRPNYKKQKHKCVRAFRKRQIELGLVQRNRSLIKLKAPIRDGWFRCLQLRSDIKRRKDAHVILSIMELLNYTSWGRSKKEIDKDWHDSYVGDMVMYSKGMKMITKQAFDKLPTGCERWFIECEGYWSAWSGFVKWYICIVPPHFFIPKYTKAYITHRKILDSQLEKELSYINEILFTKEYYLYTMKGKHRKIWMEHPQRTESRRIKQALSCYDEYELTRMGLI